MIGLPLPIVAALGDDVILPCRLEPSTDAELQTVEWLKPDAEPDPADPLSRVEYVHLYRGRRENADMKIQAYVSRTEMFADQLKHGNISLKIMNVTLADEGRCKCLVPQMDDTMFSVIQLVVSEYSHGRCGPDCFKSSLSAFSCCRFLFQRPRLLDRQSLPRIPETSEPRIPRARWSVEVSLPQL